MTRRYQQIATALYASVLLATLFYTLAQAGDFGFASPEGRGSPPGVRQWSVWGSIGILLLLIFLERQLTHKSLPDLPRREASLHLGCRFLLVTLTIMISSAPFAVYMLYPILLFTFFTFGRKVAYGVAFVSSLFVTTYVITFSQRTLLNLTDINNLFVFLLGMVMVLLLANALHHEWETSHQLQQAHNDLGESHAQLQAYAAQVATLAAADERNRLARDIHDSLGHHLTATSIQLEKAAVYRHRDSEKSAEALAHARRTIREALRDVRGSVGVLRKRETFDFNPALRDLVEQMSHRDLMIDVQITGDTSRSPSFVQMTLYRIIQEGLTNVQKHARATETAVHLTLTPDKAAVEIHDNGRGFDPTLLDQDGHYGLQGIRERVALVGGTFMLNSAPGEGTTLLVTIPQNEKVANDSNSDSR